MENILLIIVPIIGIILAIIATAVIAHIRTNKNKENYAQEGVHNGDIPLDDICSTYLKLTNPYEPNNNDMIDE